MYQARERFRPLAGFWFLNSFPAVMYMAYVGVSVPLRGSGS